MSDEKKFAPDQERGDKGHDREAKEQEQEENTSQQAGSGGRGGHRRRKGGNPDGSN